MTPQHSRLQFYANEEGTLVVSGNLGSRTVQMRLSDGVPDAALLDEIRALAALPLE